MTPKISLVAVCCSKCFLEFLEQPHVLDGDHRLIGEGFEKLDLPVRKRLNFSRRIKSRRWEPFTSNGVPDVRSLS